MEVVGVKSFHNSVGKWEIKKYKKKIECVTNGSYMYEMTTAKVQRKLSDVVIKICNGLFLLFSYQPKHKNIVEIIVR